ncbi:MAG: NAD(P)/FAD-dependent oxidoreductase [Gammaproteobacteria bacterium]|nr:NAD(P)/FAD-dependent oxidoreductase [Gammaproteobacteria bacterium]
MTAKHFGAIVIGGGHNGLTSAAYLARAGVKTLVLEQRSVIGGCCVTEEVDPVLAPGCRVSTASYMASMLRPEVIRDLELGRHGLRMLASDPIVQIALPGGRVIPWWSDQQRMHAMLKQIAPGDADAFIALDQRLKKLASYLQPYFMEPPPDIHARGLQGFLELFRAGRRMRGISGDEIAEMLLFLTGSLADLVDRYFDSDEVKSLILANNLYGKHGGPHRAGTAMGMLFHLLSGGEDEKQGFSGHVMGGMGAITQAMAAACRELGVEIRTDSPVSRIMVSEGRATGVVLQDGTEIDACVVLSNADPKRTFLGLLESNDLPPEFIRSVESIRMNGPSGKVNFVLSEEPRVHGMPADADAAQRALFTLVPSYAQAERCYNQSQEGLLPDDIWVDCVVASNVDDSLAPVGRHMLTCFVQYLPYELAQGHWSERREELGDKVMAKIAEYAPNVPGSVIARKVFTPWDLEQTFGITEGNIFHGDVCMEQLLFMRPLPGWSQYRTPVLSLYLCGAGTHPGGGVTGAPGYNAARQVLRDRKQLGL